MITIIHGNDIENSRNLLFQLKRDLKSFKQLEGEELLFNDFFSLSQGSTLFNEKPTLILENFFTKNKTNSIELKKIIELVNSDKNAEIIFWEPSELTKTQLSLIKNSEIKDFSYPKNIFLFLDNIRPNNSNFLLNLLKDVRKTTEDEIIFFMIVRQFRLMLSLKSHSKQIDEAIRLAPWQINKIEKQSTYFNQTLVSSYSLLLEVESGHKTGKYSWTMGKSIDFFLSGL